jgi:hypothetical protein
MYHVRHRAHTTHDIHKTGGKNTNIFRLPHLNTLLFNENYNDFVVFGVAYPLKTNRRRAVGTEIMPGCAILTARLCNPYGHDCKAVATWR